MTFSVDDVITSGSSSGITTNPVAASTDSLSGLTSGLNTLSTGIGSIGTAISGITSFVSQTTSYIGKEIESLKTKLPILSAIHKLESSGTALKGVQPGTNPSPTLAASTQGITTISSTLESLSSGIGSVFNSIGTALSDVTGATPQEKLANFSATVPAKETSPGVTNPAWTSFMAVPANASKVAALDSAASSITPQTTSGSTNLTAIAASDAAALAQGVAKLRNFAFAKFTSSTQPPAIQNILGKFTVPPTPEAQTEFKYVAKAKATTEVQTREASPPVATGLTPAPAVEELKPTIAKPAVNTARISSADNARYKTMNETAARIISDFKETYVNPKAAAEISWKEEVRYEEKKKAYQGDRYDKEIKAAYKEVMSQAEERKWAKDSYYWYKEAHGYGVAAWDASIDIHNRLIHGESLSVETYRGEWGNSVEGTSYKCSNPLVVTLLKLI